MKNELQVGDLIQEKIGAEWFDCLMVHSEADLDFCARVVTAWREKGLPLRIKREGRTIAL